VLTDAETRNAQIEKELLAIIVAVEKFDYYIYGRHAVVHSDHRPLQSIFAKQILQTTARLQRMFIRLTKYDLEVVYQPDKYMYIAAYLPYEPTSRDLELSADIDVRIHSTNSARKQQPVQSCHESVNISVKASMRNHRRGRLRRTARSLVV